MTKDELLLQRIAENDKGAFELVVDKYHILLWRVCRDTKSDDALCEQLVTQVFRQLWEQPEVFTGEKRLLFLLVKCCQQQVTAVDSLERF